MAVASPDVGERSSAVAAAKGAGIVAEDGDTRARVVGLLQAAGFQVVFQTRAAPSTPKSIPGEAEVEVVVLVDDGERGSVGHGVRALRTQLSEQTLIVVVGADDRRGAVQGALGAGAGAFVTLDLLDKAFVPSLGAALAGQVVVPSSRTRQLQALVLSAREKQVLALVVMGMTNAEIAGKLYLAESTVKSHLSSAFSKLGVHSRNEAAATILDPSSGLGLGILGISGRGVDGAPVGP
jgi:DNA-binding NarL/FixJ family response regulator